MCLYGGIILESYNQVIDSLLERIEKQNKIIGLYEKWIKSLSMGDEICEFIQKNMFKKVAVYGMGSLGRSLCSELKRQKIDIAYVIDKNVNISCNEFPSYTLQDKLPDVDLIIITPITYYDEIMAELEGKVNCTLLSLEDIVP